MRDSNLYFRPLSAHLFQKCKLCTAKSILLANQYFVELRVCSFVSEKTNNLNTKKWHPAWHLSKNKTLQIVLTNGIGLVPYVTLFPLVLQGNRSLEWKYFLVTVKKNDPGVWAVYGASRHVKGWRKMTAVSHQDLTAFTKQLTPFWQMEIYPKEGTNLFFSLFMFSTAKLFTNSFDLWFHLHLRWEGQPVGTNVMDFGEQHFEF